MKSMSEDPAPYGAKTTTEDDVKSFLIKLKDEVGPGHLQVSISDGDPVIWRFWAWTSGRDSIRAESIEGLRKAIAEAPEVKLRTRLTVLEAEASALRARERDGADTTVGIAPGTPSGRGSSGSETIATT